MGTKQTLLTFANPFDGFSVELFNMVAGDDDRAGPFYVQREAEPGNCNEPEGIVITQFATFAEARARFDALVRDEIDAVEGEF